MKATKLDKACIIAIKDCMGAQKNESVLIITDEFKNKIGYSLFKNAKELGHEAVYLEFKSREMHGQEPPQQIAEMMKLFDVVLCPTAKSLTHTNARRNASALGSRIATFPGITEEIMVRGLNADYHKIAALTIKLQEILNEIKVVRVTAPNGTDITMDISGRKALPSKGLFHKKGESGNLPTGEAYIAPMEGKSNGVFFVDGSMAGIGVIKGKPIKIEVVDGYAVNVTGGPQAKKLDDTLNKYGKLARNIAEFGIGTNDKAKLSGVLLEDEKVMGTIHIALGDNKSMGGNVDIPIHLDGVVKKPTVYFDDNMVMRAGKLLI
ncbi:MAG: leucyl aminopeptidase [Stygiobacter sp. RIFOXYC12_FULL_38_8]|nr:MAG: leucyl aminopeptidase [Stygiobacter sp. RIFOXYC2_FULL_38_25]OGV17887.1 MAG: leucyl aminopeptidase [Stygiobacter sp. RIFOXYA2_FULL_38_8]OGV27261.1 MAG: leucyl aminopeptidase [Stygiobacter sp. RIFOXYC12_FULL_38_8]OGV79036.1 MAG: leucyl aminopeptidase [Stygiobacter sp. GWF2_38_21]OGV95267.1 MAG: leucyl aminopeptidase [Melioribacter sp. RIFOXYB12_FULL_38_5]RJQ64338.1 MAG: aminopeptidase [Stygiobacter sp.]